MQHKGNLMEIVDPLLEDKFDKEEAKKMIRVALLCSNAGPALRPTRLEVVSICSNHKPLLGKLHQILAYMVMICKLNNSKAIINS